MTVIVLQPTLYHRSFVQHSSLGTPIKKAHNMKAYFIIIQKDILTLSKFFVYNNYLDHTCDSILFFWGCVLTYPNIDFITTIQHHHVFMVQILEKFSYLLDMFNTCTSTDFADRSWRVVYVVFDGGKLTCVYYEWTMQIGLFVCSFVHLRATFLLHSSDSGP